MSAGSAAKHGVANAIHANAKATGAASLPD